MSNYGLKGPHAQYLIAMNRFPQGATAAQLSAACERDNFMTADEALAFGIIDRVLEHH
mgnify:CR=1 FL=1